MELMAASKQWSSRPPDQRFWTLKELYLESFAQASESRDTTISINRLGVKTDGDSIVLQTPFGELNPTFWSFGQLCRTIGAPADFLRTVNDPDLVKRNMDNRLAAAAKTYKANPDFQLYFNEADSNALAITRAYSRFPNYKLAKKLMNLQGNWRTAPGAALDAKSPTARKATKEDVNCATYMKEGELIDKAGLYMSPEDCFIFLHNPDTRINDGSDGGLCRGFFASNSEVGKKRFKLTTFLFRAVCANNIVWGAQDVDVFSRKHTGDNATQDILDGIDASLKDYSEMAASKDEVMIKAAQKEIWSGFDDLSDDLAEMGWTGFGKRKIEEAYAISEKYAGTDGSPLSPWGVANSITRLSQRTIHADQRANLDFAAGAVLRKFVAVG